MKYLMKTIAVSLFVTGVITVSAANLLTDTKFSVESGWNSYVAVVGGKIAFEDGEAIAKSPAIEKQVDANLQIIKEINIDANRSYKFKFKANTEKAGKLAVVYILSKYPYTVYANADIALEPGEKDYECILAVNKDTNGNYYAPRSLRIYPGAFKDATVTLSNVSLEEVK
ncbi:MAG: hypothetical protein WCS96_15075 [Victivallales bacterium]